MKGMDQVATVDDIKQDNKGQLDTCEDHSQVRTYSQVAPDSMWLHTCIDTSGTQPELEQKKTVRCCMSLLFYYSNQALPEL